MKTEALACRKLSDVVVAQLVCPCCRGELATSARAFITCQSCQAKFPIVDGIPILIDDKNSVFAVSDFVSRRDTYFSTSPPLKQRLRGFIPSLSRNIKAEENYANFASLLRESAAAAKPRVLILGGSIMGEGMGSLLSRSDIEFVESDVAFGPRTGIILDGHAIPFSDSSFDGIIVQAVLEHVVDPYRVVDEIHRVLKDDGIVYSDTPFMQQVHGGPYDFTRFTHLGHRRLFRKFDEIGSGAVCGTGMALAWSYKFFLMSMTNNKIARKLLATFAAFTSFFLKYLDYLTIDNSASLDAASGYWFIGRKSSATLSDRELLLAYRGVGRAAGIGEITG